MPSKLFAPITIILYAGPAGGHSIKHTYYFKAISGWWARWVPTPLPRRNGFTDRRVCRFATDPYGPWGQI